MRRFACLLASLAVALLGLAAPAPASHTPDGLPTGEDFVTGEWIAAPICAPIACLRPVTVFDAHSYPRGEDPTGTVGYEYDYGGGGRERILTWNVTCLSVTGNRATVGGVSTSAPVAIQNAVWAVEDGGAGAPDRVSVSFPDSPPTTCPAFPTSPPPAIESGDITVHDALGAPTSADQCKKGGWSQFGFDNQGRCIAFVNRGAQP